MATLSPKELQYQLAHRQQNRGTDIIVSNAILLVAAYVAVALRFVSRRLSHSTLQADDWMIAVGLFLTTCFVIGCFVCVSLGLGKHAVLLLNPVPFAQAVLTTEVLYTPASTSIKFSILLLYRRLFPIRKLIIVLWCIASFLVVFALAQMLSVIIQCTPLAALWDPFSHPNATCGNYDPALILFAAINAATDIAILCLPMPILWRLKVSKTRRQQLIGVFSLGGLVCIVSLCRTAYVNEVSLTDPSWDDVNTVILSSVENCAGVISACLPTMLPLWRYLRHGNAQGSRQNTSRQSTFGSDPKRHTSVKLSALKPSLWSSGHIRKPTSSRQEGSFTRLHHSRNKELHASSGINGFSEPTNGTPYRGHGITVTTDLEQSQEMTPSNHPSVKGRPSDW